MSTKVNTTKSVAKPLPVQHKEQLEAISKKLKEQKKVKVSLPENLAKHVGSEAFFSINGVKLILPIPFEGEVPKSFAKHIENWKDNLTR